MSGLRQSLTESKKPAPSLDDVLDRLLKETSGLGPSLERATDALLMATVVERIDVRRRLVSVAVRDVFELAVAEALRVGGAGE